MRPCPRPLYAPMLLMLSACAVALPATAETPPQVTIYRCTDANGRVAIGDRPCADSDAQEVRSMLRPVDGTPTARPEPPAVTEVVDTPAPQVIVMRPPQPMYRCVRPDGSDYTSDTSDGNPRWVPLWTMGYGRAPGAGGQRVAQGGYYGAGTWVRDECRPMPQSEVCGILTNRREEIRRRFFNAQPTERAQLTSEERTITTRLSQDCGR